MNKDSMYVIVKLVTGENVMAVFREEDEKHILIENPMVMRSILNYEEGKEHLTASPLCVFTDDPNFVIPKSSIMYIKKLHHTFIPHYKKIVKEHENTSFVPNTQDTLDWGDETPTAEEARKMIKQLKEVFKEEEEIDWKEKLRMLVPGNDTIN